VDSDKRIRQDRGSVKTDCKMEVIITQIEKYWLFEFELLIDGVPVPNGGSPGRGHSPEASVRHLNENYHLNDKFLWDRG